MQTEQRTNVAVGTLLLPLVGAAIGGVIGFFGFEWLLRQGFYALLLPGALLGLGAGFLVRERSMSVSAVCGLAALVLGLFSEWHARPFVADPSLGYFLAHLTDLQPLTLIMILAGGGAGFYFSLGRKR